MTKNPLTLYPGIGSILNQIDRTPKMSLSISQVANAADVNVQTIRYYERRGLFPTPRRTPAGDRQYADDAVPRLRFIKHAQALGLRLQQIQQLLALPVRHRGARAVVG